MTLDLTINEINIILQALGNAPYVSVAEVIEKIRTQAQAQVQPTPTESLKATTEAL
jgi:hypothetical protein